MTILWEEPMASEWVSAHDWFKEYDEMVMRELNKRRLIEHLMQTMYTPEVNPGG